MKKIEGSNKKVISVQEDTKIPGTDIILEKGDKIQVLDEADDPQRNFTNFVKELGRLSTKYGIAIKSIGGVAFLNKGDKVNYLTDYTSGDLEYTIQ